MRVAFTPSEMFQQGLLGRLCDDSQCVLTGRLGSSTAAAGQVVGPAASQG